MSIISSCSLLVCISRAQPPLCSAGCEAAGDWFMCWQNNVDTTSGAGVFPCSIWPKNWPSSRPGWFDPPSGVYRDITSLAGGWCRMHIRAPPSAPRAWPRLNILLATWRGRRQRYCMRKATMDWPGWVESGVYFIYGHISYAVEWRGCCWILKTFSG